MSDRKHLEKALETRKRPAGLNKTDRGLRAPGGYLTMRAYILIVFFIGIGLMGRIRAESQDATAEFRVKYVYSGSVYIDAGSSSGLKAGQKLSIRRMSSGTDSGGAEVVGKVELESVASTSSAGRILFSTSGISPGDIAFVEPEVLTRSSRDAAPAVLPTRNEKPAAAAPSVSSDPSSRNVNRVRGRIGIDYSTLRIPESGGSSSQFGFLLRLDATRIAGTHWNIQGYHRGRLQSRTSSLRQETLTDLINRTYHLNITYNNPDSNWVVGAGRLNVPWANSLDTIDGFYLGRKFGSQTAGLFLGTAPDPTSWNYNPDRQTGGVFYNIERGSFDGIRFNSTTGIALSRIDWRPDRQFGFFENGFFLKRTLSVYSNIEVDLLTGAQNNNRSEAVLSRSHFTVRLQPHKIISFNLNQNYLRDIPTFDTQLIGTGLLDKYLFQGFSGGFRLSLPYGIGIYSDAGRSSRTGDRRASWNYLAGASVSDILGSGVRTGFRFSKFDSSFGRGTYKSLSLSRDIGESLQFEIQGGQQDYASLFSSQDRARFVHGSVDWFLGRSYFLGGGGTVYRGQVQDYNQYFIHLGYRFDNRRRR